MAEATADDAAVRRARRLGVGYNLALRCSVGDEAEDAGLHCSLVYFNNVGSDYEKQLIKQTATDCLAAWYPGTTHVDLVLGKSCYDRSVEVTGLLAGIQKKLEQHFVAVFPSFSVKLNPLLHIDCKHFGVKGVQRRVQLLDNWLA